MTTQVHNFQPLNFICNICGHAHTKYIKLIAPEAYTDSSRATMLKQFWCDKCNTPLAFRIKFNRDNDKIMAVLAYQVDPNSVPTPQLPGTGITIRPKQKSYTR